MKNLLVCICLLLYVNTYSQIEKNIDKFTGRTRLVSQNAPLWAKGLTGDGFTVNLRSDGDVHFLIVHGSTFACGTVGINDALLLLTDSGSVTIYPSHIQTTVYDSYWKRYGYDHQYKISLDQIKFLASHHILSARRYFDDKYADFDVKEKHRDNVKNLCILYLEALKP